VEVVRWLLDHGADPKHLIDVRQSALYKAAETGRLEIARLLLARNVPINDADRLHWTPLGIAARNGHAAVVELLASQPGIQLNARNGKASVTALQLAAQAGHLPVVSALIAKGADVNDRGGEKWSPLEAAQQLGYPAIAERLKAAGAH
jgi:ankyrin repeat protein